MILPTHFRWGGGGLPTSGKILFFFNPSLMFFSDSTDQQTPLDFVILKLNKVFEYYNYHEIMEMIEKTTQRQVFTIFYCIFFFNLKSADSGMLVLPEHFLL